MNRTKSISWEKKGCAFSFRFGESLKRLSLLVGNFLLFLGMDGCPKEKNVCALESSLVLIEIYTKSFGGKNLACAIDFLPSKV